MGVISAWGPRTHLPDIIATTFKGYFYNQHSSRHSARPTLRPTTRRTRRFPIRPLRAACMLNPANIKSDPRIEFFRGLRDHPDRFLRLLRDGLGIKLWARQEEIFRAAFEAPEVYVRTGNSTGKTFAAGVIGCGFLFCKQPSKVIYIATKLAQAKRQAWAEFLGVYSRFRALLAGLNPPLYLPEPLTESVTLGQDWFATVWAGSHTDEEAFHGFHGRSLLVVADEASGIEDPIRNALNRCLTGADNHLLALGNPLKRYGWFYADQQDPPEWRRVIHVSTLDVPNVVEGREIIPGLATRDWVERAREEYGEDSPFWQASILGEFPQEADDALIPWSAIQAAVEREIEPDRRRLAIGVDVARYGSDSSVICVLAGDAVVDLLELRKHDTMSVAGWVLETMRKWDADVVAVDKPGLGGGPIDRLREQGVAVLEWEPGGAPDDKSKFRNRKAEEAWALRKRMMDGELSIPDHERLTGELAGWRYDFDSSGRIRLIDPPKSPDFADALLIAHWAQRQGRWDPDVVSLPDHRAEEWRLEGW